MFLKKLIGPGRLENEVIQDMDRHIRLLGAGCEAFLKAIRENDHRGMRRVKELEREADAIRRDIVHHIYEGAFLPYLRPELSKFVEIVDQVFDLLEYSSACYLEIRFPDSLRSEAARVAFLNLQMCEMLRITLRTMTAGKDLREKLLAIRVYEKRVDDLKFGLMKDARAIHVNDFWEGDLLSGFLSRLCSVSDLIEDASDHLAVISSIIK
jgi:uncharacterized protein